MALGWAAALLVAAPAPGRAQGLLPTAGADVRLGDLRQQFAQAFQSGPTISPPGWTYTPSLDVSLAWTDAVAPLAGGKRKADFYTTISPSLTIQGDGPKLSGMVTIAPQLRRYLSTPAQNSTSLNFTGQGLLTLVPDTFFIRMSGLAFTQSQTGGYTSVNSGNLGRRDQIQTVTVTIDPTLQHRFGGTGTAELGYALSQTTVSGANATVTSPFQQPVTNQSTTNGTLHASFTSGEDFGRLGFGAQVIHSNSTGSGTASGTRRARETVNLSYAVTRTIQVIGTVGHEFVSYRAPTNYRFDGLTWDAKVKMQPNPDSSISAGYGKHEGRNSLSLDATYALTARIRLVAQYSESLTTGQESARQLLNGAVLNSSGIPVDPVTGLPLGIGSNFFGAQTSPARVRLLMLGATLLRDRDIFSINLQRQETNYITTSAPGLSTRVDNTGLSAGFTWQHDFSEPLNGSLSLQYGTRHTSGASQQTVGVSLGLTYAFSPTLSGRARYSYNGSSGGGSTLQTYQQNLITVGLHKSF